MDRSHNWFSNAFRCPKLGRWVTKLFYFSGKLYWSDTTGRAIRMSDYTGVGVDTFIDLTNHPLPPSYGQTIVNGMDSYPEGKFSQVVFLVSLIYSWFFGLSWPFTLIFWAISPQTTWSGERTFLPIPKAFQKPCRGFYRAYSDLRGHELGGCGY